MAQCVACYNETELYEGGVPICLDCSVAEEARRKRKVAALTPRGTVREALLSRVAETSAKADSASRLFLDITSQTPSGIPHPDGVQRIYNASRDLTLARNEAKLAQKQLHDFITAGIIPEHLKSEC